MTNKHMKRGLTSVVIRKIKINATPRYHFTWLLSRRWTIMSAVEDGEKLGSLYIASRNVKWCRYCEKSGSSSKS